MAARGKLRRGETQLGFEALSIEGGLLSPDWLSRVAQLQAGHQSEADYRVPKGLALRDEIGRYWRIAQAHWGDFAVGRSSEGDARALAERVVSAVLRESFGFASLAEVEPSVIAERSYPIGFSAVGGRVPVVIAPAGVGLDSLSPIFGDGSRRRSAFGLAQEFLNAADDAKWGLVSDGMTLRILRDNASLTRPAWIEADLARIFTEERFADFAALWLLAHETRFGRPDEPKDECALETWRDAGREEGTRARQHLRRGVEEALLALGQGFLGHPQNQTLRAALQDGSLTTTALFQQLLRLVYRLIFVLTVEERGLLHPDHSSEEARRLYSDGFSLRRMRDRSVRRSAHDRFSDLWEGTKIVLRGLATGEPRLALPALAGIFATSQCPALDGARLENRALLLAVFRLAWLREASGLSRVNWRDMGSEELGSVYEGLLELVPQITLSGRQFAFATGGEAKGHARKTTGSYYTPDSLVQLLLDSALEPAIGDTVAKNPESPVEALLGLSIVDPACGSGHFLLAGARRLAAHVARLQAGGTPSAAEYRHALREVVGRCIYGVDLNPLAVELCKVSLWMEAVEPGLPLTFLNSHIQHGNALLGTTLELMGKGVPDAAWKPIEGDDPKTASTLKRRNKNAAAGQRSLDTLWAKPSAEGQAVARAVAELEAANDASPEALAKKESQWDGILGSPEYRHQKFIADAWCGAFVWPKQPSDPADAAPTNELWRQLRDGQGQPPALTTKTVNALAEQYRFFHWHLQFPQVFSKGGFDVVLGNPPWDEVQFEETAWFASRDAEVAASPNAAARAELIANLENTNAALFAEYRAGLRLVDGTKHFVRASGVYPTGSSGKLNTATLFTARASHLSHARTGTFGLVVPTGIATDKGTSDVFEDLMSSGRLRSLYDFVNQQLLFPAVRPHQHFCLLTAAGPRRGGAAESESDFAAFLLDPSELGDRQRRYRFTWSEIVALSPEAKALPLFSSRIQAEVSQKLCARFVSLGAQTEDTDWKPRYQQGTFNTASASDLFRIESDLVAARYHRRGLALTKTNAEEYVPLFDAKMARQFEWRAASVGFSGHQFRKVSKTSSTAEQLRDPAFVPEFAYWVPRGDADARLHDWTRTWVLGFKDVTGVTSTRLAAFAFVPRMGFADKFPLLRLAGDAVDHAFVAAWLNCLLVEWFLRQRMHGVSLTWHILSQVPVPPRTAAYAAAPWQCEHSVAQWVAPRVAELSCTSWLLSDLARELVGRTNAFDHNHERRFLLRVELEAAFFHLARFSTEDALFVMDSLDKVEAREVGEFGEYRSRKEIPVVMSALAEAERTGKPYETRLDPPPANPRVAHALGPRASERGFAK